MPRPENRVPNRAEAKLLPDLDDTVVLRASYNRQSFALHSHPTYVLALVTRGALRFRCGNEVFVAPSGSACLINPGEVQTGEAASDPGWSYWSAYVPASVFGMVETRADQAHAPLFASPVVSDGAVTQALSLFFSDVHISPSLARTEQRLACLSRVAERCGTGAALETGEASPRLVRRARDFMAENFGAALKLDDVAGACGVTGFHLTRAFRRHTGLALHAWLVQHRIERARARLLSGEAVADTAVACGFSDQAHMTRWFRRVLGLTPGDVRAMSRMFKTGTPPLR